MDCELSPEMAMAYRVELRAGILKSVIFIAKKWKGIRNVTAGKSEDLHTTDISQVDKSNLHAGVAVNRGGEDLFEQSGRARKLRVNIDTRSDIIQARLRTRWSARHAAGWDLTYVAKQFPKLYAHLHAEANKRRAHGRHETQKSLGDKRKACADYERDILQAKTKAARLTAARKEPLTHMLKRLNHLRKVEEWKPMFIAADKDLTKKLTQSGLSKKLRMLYLKQSNGAAVEGGERFSTERALGHESMVAEEVMWVAIRCAVPAAPLEGSVEVPSRDGKSMTLVATSHCQCPKCKVARAP
mmetsp:Transcript_171/g.375  ORF Transcript_171/g.375 Transcript_171/m.375 type:complete len:299 (+) Transcript_171:669-1565(+)